MGYHNAMYALNQWRRAKVITRAAHVQIHVFQNEVMYCISKRGYQTKKRLAPSVKALVTDNGVIKETYVKEGKKTI